MLEHAKRGYAAAKAAGAFREIGATGGNGASVTSSCSIISAELMVAGLCHMSLFQQMAGYELMAKGCRTAQVAAEPQRRPGRPQACSARDRTSRRPAWFAGCELLGGLGRLIEISKDLSSALARPWPVKSARISSRTQPHPTKKAEAEGGAEFRMLCTSLLPCETSSIVRSSKAHEDTMLKTLPSNACAADRMRIASVRL